MLRNRKIIKSHKSLFAYQTNRSGDSFEKHEDLHSSSSSDTLSSDFATHSCTNSSSSSLTTSSDNSLEFNEVEKVIEEYFIRKLGRNSESHSFNIHNIATITEIEKFKYLKTSNFDIENLFWKDTSIPSAEIGTQVCNSDFKYAMFQNKNYLRSLRSKSLDLSKFTGIWSYHKNLKFYLIKSGILMNTNLNLMLRNSFVISAKICNTMRHTEKLEYNNYFGLHDYFGEYYSRFKKFELSLNTDQLSPFKAILLVDKRTSKILLCNDKAKYLFKLEDLQFPQFFDSFLCNKLSYTYLLDYYFDNNGKVRYLTAKMIVCKDSTEYKFYVSARFQEINNIFYFKELIDPILVIIEPVIITQGRCIICDDNIVAFNNEFVDIFRLNNVCKNNVFSESFYKLCQIKSQLIDSRLSVQKIKHNVLKFTNQDLPFYVLSFMHSILESEIKMYSMIYNLHTLKTDNMKGNLYCNLFWFYSNLSNVLTISLNGQIIDCDPYFNVLVGYSKSELIKCNINTIIKFNSFEFDAILLFKKSNGKYEATLHHLNGSNIKCIAWINKNEANCDTNFYTLWLVMDVNKCKFLDKFESQIKLGDSLNLNGLLFELYGQKYNKSINNKTNISALQNYYQIEGRNKNLPRAKKKKAFSLPEKSINNGLKLSPWSLLTTFDVKHSNTSSRSSEHLKEISLTKDSDIFHRDYSVLNIIGKGAFGFVRLATAISSKKEFVVKFIRKSKLAIEHMVKVPLKDVNKSQRRSKLIFGYESTSEDKIIKPIEDNIDEIYIFIPREIWMLCQLSHDNIVSLYDWYEGVDHYQMIMPKHGVGMDLFEFIDRSPLLDESLVSYIFRQLADAVSYLHDLMISHRDIKDENIILDNVFEIKLIDFGAAVKVEPDQKFKTFCGTMEFCSPEILLGQEYNCFHADIWSMGITLYTIMFGENPFYDFEETINAVLKPPKSISSDLFQLLSMLLEPNPLNRITAKNARKHVWLNQNIDITRYSFEEIVPNSVFSGNMASDFRKYSIDSNCEMVQSKMNCVVRNKDSN